MISRITIKLLRETLKIFQILPNKVQIKYMYKV